MGKQHDDFGIIRRIEQFFLQTAAPKTAPRTRGGCFYLLLWSACTKFFIVVW